MKQSAGLLLFKRVGVSIVVFLVHPGGPYWKNKDLGSWSIPKGEFTDNEDPLDAAKREFREETGSSVDGDFIALTPVKLRSGKQVFAWAVEMDMNADRIISNTFEIEWPPKSGQLKSFPEIDKAEWFSTDDAFLKINSGQTPFISELLTKLKLA